MKVKETAEETGNAEKRTYTEETRAGRNPARRLSKINNAGNKHKQNIHEKLCSVSPWNRFRRQGGNLSKNPSNTTTTNTYRQQQKINEFQAEINKLKHQQVAKEQPNKTKAAHHIANLSQAIPENVNTASVTNRGQQGNIGIITVINFVKQTMVKLSKYREQFEQLKTQLDFTLTQQVM